MDDYYLDTYGYSYYPVCTGLEISKNGKVIWESSLVDSDQGIDTWSLEHLRAELRAYLDKVGLSHLYNPKIDEETCVYDWKLLNQLSTEEWNKKYAYKI